MVKGGSTIKSNYLDTFKVYLLQYENENVQAVSRTAHTSEKEHYPPKALARHARPNPNLTALDQAQLLNRSSNQSMSE